MKCPVCEEMMDSLVCACGYDRSRDYERYPTLAPVPAGLESAAALRIRRSDLVRCAGCGYYGFSMSRTTGEMKCIRCGQVPMEKEVGSVTERLNLKNAELRELEASLDAKTMELEYIRSLMMARRCDLDELLSQIAERERQMAELKEVSGKQEDTPVHSDIKSRFKASGEPLRIKAIAANYDVTAAVYSDGTVRAIGKADYGRCAVTEWENVVSVAVCDEHTLGLTDQRTVLCTGKGEIPRTVARWKGITAISANRTSVFGLKEDGTVVAANGGAARKEIALWRGIKAISAGHGYVVGLKWDGTVVAAGKNDKGQCQVSQWKNIKWISAGTTCTIGLQKDGSAVNTGYKKRIFGRYLAVYQNIHQFEGEGDQDMIYGLCEDKSVAGIYYYPDVYQKTVKWGKMDMLVVVRGSVIGLKEDGTVVSAGNGYTGMRDVIELNRGVV